MLFFLVYAFEIYHGIVYYMYDNLNISEIKGI